jgi:hypothetical protein
MPLCHCDVMAKCARHKCYQILRNIKNKWSNLQYVIFEDIWSLDIAIAQETKTGKGHGKKGHLEKKKKKKNK